MTLKNKEWFRCSPLHYGAASPKTLHACPPSCGPTTDYSHEHSSPRSASAIWRRWPPPATPPPPLDTNGTARLGSAVEEGDRRTTWQRRRWRIRHRRRLPWRRLSASTIRRSLRLKFHGRKSRLTGGVELVVHESRAEEWRSPVGSPD